MLVLFRTLKTTCLLLLFLEVETMNKERKFLMRSEQIAMATTRERYAPTLENGAQSDLP